MEASLLWETVFSSAIISSISLVVLCLRSEISLISFAENFFVAKNRLYLPSRTNEIKPAFLRMPKWNSAIPIAMPSPVQMPLNWIPGLATMYS